MRVELFDKYEFFTGVPDSLLRPLCDWLMSTKGISKNHIIAANEGNAVGLAAGYHLATGEVPVVYMQNSGLGNTINPVASLTNPQIYGIPMLFIIGWRGEPGMPDEPQHIYQGKMTSNLLDIAGIQSFIIDKSTSENEFIDMEAKFANVFKQGCSGAYVIRKNALEYDKKVNYENNYSLLREKAVRLIIDASEGDIIVSTTGKTSRELYELRCEDNHNHECDFLAVGSMGHCSSIAMGIAMHRLGRRVWVIDGDGAAIMHMGAMATIGASGLSNLVHIVLNNASHESVGGMPTVAGKVDLCKIAEGCGYSLIKHAHDEISLSRALGDISNKRDLCFLEIKTAVGSRPGLGRPLTPIIKLKEQFMEFITKE